MADSENPFARIYDDLAAKNAERFGFADRTPAQILDLACLLLTALPQERLKPHLEHLAGSPSKLDRLHARQLSFILFTASEIRKSVIEMSDDDRIDALFEFLRRGPDR